MRLQEHMIEVIEQARAEVFRSAKAVPADKLDWKPLDAGRSVIEIARELAVTPDWARYVLSGNMPEAEGEDAEKQKAEYESLRTVEDCEAACLEKLPALFEAIRAVPDEKLKETRWLPFQGGRDFTFEEMIDYPRWNFNYHLGQIGYIQTLYGDMEDH